MPFFEEAASPAYVPPHHEVARRWAAKVNSLDGFIFVTAEYSHGPTAVLTNALDYAYREFDRKPAAYVGYGGVGAAPALSPSTSSRSQREPRVSGAGAIEQRRLINVELQVWRPRAPGCTSAPPP